MSKMSVRKSGQAGLPPERWISPPKSIPFSVLVLDKTLTEVPIVKGDQSASDSADLAVKT